MKSLIYASLGMCTTLLISSFVVAQVSSQRPEAISNPIVQQFLRKSGPGWKVRLTPDNKRIESIVGLGTRSYGEKPEAAARTFLTENAQLFGLKSDLGDLRVLSQISSAVSGHVEFQQMVNGLLVENARVQVNLSRDGRIFIGWRLIRKPYGALTQNWAVFGSTPQARLIGLGIAVALFPQLLLAPLSGKRLMPIGKSFPRTGVERKQRVGLKRNGVPEHHPVAAITPS